MALGSGQGTILNGSFVSTSHSLPPLSFTPTVLATFLPTSTTAPASSSTETSSGGGGGPSSFLSANGTPALILAFLAIGLFSGGAIALFGLRRYVRDRRDPNGRWARRRQAFLGMRGVEMEGGSPDAIGGAALWEKKPELWDLRAVDEVGVKWADVQPISAKLVSEKINSSSPSPPPSPQVHSHTTTLLPFNVSSVISTRPRAFANAAARRRTSRHHRTNSYRVTSQQLHVAVAIAMPVPPDQRGERDGDSETQIPVYALGLTHMSWGAPSGALDTDDREGRDGTEDGVGP